MAKIILFNADVVTMDEAMPSAQAVLVEEGKIVKVGTNEEILALKDGETLVRDLEGKILMPGFIDPHSHFTAVAYALLMVNAKPSPSGRCDTKEALLEEFKKNYEENMDAWAKGEWLMAMGYDPSVFPDKQHITRHDLDTISTEVPISCIHASGHMSVLNTKALQMLGYWGDFEVPEGGTVEMLPDGTPHGLVTELAYMDPAVQAKTVPPSFERVLGALGKAANLYASYGLTTAQDGRVTNGELQLLNYGGQMGFINIDVVGLADPGIAEEVLVKGQKVGPYSNHTRIGGYKLFLDGSPQGKTAWLSKPYYEVPDGYDADYCGFQIFPDEEVVRHCKICLENDWQLNVHCNGDAACEQLIRCYTQAIEETGLKKDLRPVMVHCQTVRDDQLDRMAEIGMVASFFLDHIHFWGDYHYTSVLGHDRGMHISPIREALKRGINYTMHQDSPVVNPNALFAVHNAVNRKTPAGRVLGEDQKLTAYEALKAITINGAYQIFEEDSKGSVTAGKVADLVVLDSNPMKVDGDKIKDIVVLETIKEGKTIYTA